MNKRSGIYRESFHLKLGLKPDVFHFKLVKRSYGPLPTHLGRFSGRICVFSSSTSVPKQLGLMADTWGAFQKLGVWHPNPKIIYLVVIQFKSLQTVKIIDFQKLFETRTSQSIHTSFYFKNFSRLSQAANVSLGRESN